MPQGVAASVTCALRVQRVYEALLRLQIRDAFCHDMMRVRTRDMRAQICYARALMRALCHAALRRRLFYARHLA